VSNSDYESKVTMARSNNQPQMLRTA
jgi:hypothetical protein